jgi:chromosome partitioning protein
MQSDIASFRQSDLKECRHDDRRSQNMKTVAVISQKGGSGKSTLSIHLATEAARAGGKALLIDLDPQGNAVRWAARRGEELPPDVSAESPASIESVLINAVRDGYDIVFFDTAPNADRTALHAAKAADLVLIPCRPSQFDIEAIGATLDLCELAKRQAVVVLNAAPIRSRVVEEAREAITGRNATVCPVVIRERVALRHCMPDGRVAAELDAEGQAAKEITALYKNMMLCLNVGIPAKRHVKA